MMTNRLAKYSDQELIEIFHRVRKSEVTAAADILLLISEIERRRFHLKSSDSMYKYLKKTFQYSKDEAYTRIKATAAYAIEASVEPAIRQKKTCLSHMKEAYVAIINEAKRRKANKEPALTRVDQRALILKVIENQEATKTIANAFPKLRPEKNEDRPIAGNRHEITITTSDEDYSEYLKAKALLSNKLPTASWSEVITESIKRTVKELTPKPPKAAANETATDKQRKYISVNTERHLNERCGGQCEWVDPESGVRCDSRHQLETEHVRPVAKGGTDTFNNLRKYCRAHNQYAAWTQGLQQKMKREFRPERNFE